MQARSDSNVKVIDVSHYQGTIDWKKAHADGVMGAFIKASEGTGITDSAFATNAVNAPAAGLRVGFYHYSHPEKNDAKSEAAYFASVVAGRKADFPHVLDVEGQASQVPSDKLTDWCVQWLKEVTRLTGHDTMVYTGASFAKSYLGKSLGAWPLWVAHYGVDQPMANDTWDEWAVFQYTSSGSVKGINGNVDMNAMEKAFYDHYSGVVVVKPINVEDTIKVVVNDVLVAYGRNVNGSVYAPLRQLGESMGATVTWDPVTQMPYVNGTPVAQFILFNGSAYVSVRAAALFLGGTVTWDGKTQKVYIYY
ncbi:glycoside hydrolase [Paenibacillus rhizovicinus]|uniref:Glycoside hydrolase n=1 Tax=Paenibacillus rhizovicinus TaxID=2704463 RepID=A0A6C0P360_9BACL|nr:GH25 family lysozyme [Paenibacillus rhizovicinus]QHW32974.1 glycoside hydrolase [Paenibacillus rhizovicinus]